MFLSLLPLLLSFSFLYFFLFFAYLHLFWSTSSGIFYFLHNKSQFRPLLAWIIRGRQTHLLEKKYIRQYVTLWLVDFPRQNGQYSIFCSSKSVLLGERSLLRDAFPGSYLRHDSFTLTKEFRFQLFLQQHYDIQKHIGTIITIFLYLEQSVYD